MTASGRRRPWDLGRRRAEASAPRQSVPARTELSDAFADPTVGNHQLFGQLTGTREQLQLWWRSCREAVQSQPGWLHHADHNRALALIHSEEPIQSLGAISRAAEAVDMISQALAGGDPRADVGQHKSTLERFTAGAASCWADSLAIHSPKEGTAFQAEAALARVNPELRDKVRRLLACLNTPDSDRGQAMTAITALLLARQGSKARRAVRVPGYWRKGAVPRMGS